MAVKGLSSFHGKNWRHEFIREQYRINNQIRYPELRIIMGTGENLGVMKTSEALKIAREKDLDVVLITEGANPPIAKILDFNKFLYDERKKTSAIKAKSKKSEIKEFVFGPTIDTGDLTTRIERSKDFIKDGNRVKVTVKFKGRENEHPAVGIEKLNRFIEELKEIAKPEAEPKKNGNLLTVTFTKI